jgi:hypothetical protein
MNHRREVLVASAALALVAGGGAFLLLRPSPTGVENGRYEADCCGTLELRDGEMVLNDRARVSFDVGRDGTGPYLMPHPYYVGGLDAEGFEVDGTRPALKLRLDRLPRPETIRLPAAGPDFVMKRMPVRARARR